MIALLTHAALVAATAPAKTTNPLVSLAPILLIGVVFYFLLIRPQQRRAKAQREMTQSTDVGDEVVTIGGIFGVVRELDDDSVLLEVAPGTELRFLKSAIARKLAPEDEVPADDEDEPDEESEHHYLEPDDRFGTDSGADGKK
jgi:preprotein translocase subunit YajC